MIIDIHTHAFPDSLAERATTALSEKNGIAPFADGTVAGLRASMCKAGIDRSVIAPIATKPSQVATINQWAAGVNEQYPDLTCLGTLHPFQDDWAADIDRLLSDGIIGVKMHPDYQDFYVDDPKVLPLYRLLADAGLMLVMHAGADCGLPPPVHCPPDRLAHVLDAAPGLTVIAAHMGGWMMWDEVRRYLAGRDLYLETSFSLAYAGSEAVADLIRAHGVDRVLFGTDSPWADQASELAAVRALPFTADEITAITGGTAERLLARASC